MPDTATPPTAPAVAPTPAPASSSGDWAALDRFMPVDKPVEPAPAADTTDDAPETPVAPAAETPTPVKPPDDKSARTITPGNALRKERDRAVSEAETLRKQSADLQARITEAESRGKDTSALSERLAAIERERDEARADAARARQEVSPELKAKYQVPFNEAAEAARELISQFLVNNPDGTTRAANWDADFGSVFGLPYPEAKRRAAELFGEESGIVMQKYLQLHEMNRAFTKAKETEAGQWKERETTQQAERVRQQEGWKAAQSTAEKGYREKYPHFFGEDPKDPEWNEALKAGAADLDLQPKTFQEAATHRARIRLKAQAFDGIALRLSKANARVAELEAKLAGKNSAGPGGGKVDVSKPTADDGLNLKDLEARLKRLS